MASAAAEFRFRGWTPRQPGQLFTAAVFGASGSVGRRLVAHLVRVPACRRIVLLNRRHVADLPPDARIEQHQVDMDALHDATLAALASGSGTPSPSAADADADAGATVAFVLAGIGAPSSASKDELFRVDVLLPSEFGRACRAAGASHALLLTSVGADANAAWSPITRSGAGGGWYFHCKGQVEQNFLKMGFDSVSAVRPSTLVGSPNTPSWVPFVQSAIDWALPARFNRIDVDNLAAAFVSQSQRALDRQLTRDTLNVLEGKELFDSI
ncbi:hypothetical protein HK100_007824 [Physocladia obscura]|uniref:NAD(P)-binding domain-containing protein n=1 Tax=Physocladia obscura TaxID=109957 RepID=A0AAD5SPZ4_9FUNG|nr:hypothetical protein HK100_007824 [Physocladia obscura]